ncbi:MAG: acetolactate synthase large subunit [Candidatus Schekmanbacteria bacterium]|nr:MAG: acetolactate synthase large subunit [Candidatus Schekmanbacteria bacterium]
MKASDMFVKQLEEEGVTHIFGLPGEENLDLLDSLRKSSIKIFITRHEQAAAFMAATYGRLTGKAGVCFSTLGPGATNLVTGIAHSQLIGAPLVSISGQKALKNNIQGKFQIVDIVNLMKPITKKSISILDAETIPTVIRDAFKTAESERPGAVHIELPEDIASSDCRAKIQKRTNIRRPSPDKKAIEKAVKLIEESKNPLVIVSSGANRKLITKHLLAFLEKTGIYVVHTSVGKGVISDEFEQSLYTMGIHGRDYISCGIERADLIITIGYSIIEYPPYIWNSDLSKKIVNIDFVESEPDRYFNPDVEVIGDISHSLREISSRIKERREFPIFKKLRFFLTEKLYSKYEKKYPLLPQEVVDAVREALMPYDIVSLDNGIYKLWFSRLYRTYEPNTLLLDNALATMGAGLPAAIAAKILNPEKKVIAVCGDGGFMMNSQEMETALRYKVPVVILLLNDNGFGFIKWKQKHMKLERFGLDFSNPDFVKYAESYGAKGLKVSRNDDIRDVLRKALNMNELVLVECEIDYSINYEVFSNELSQLVCEI